ncbi:unnamed protein product [Camellia sinensis]
MSTSTSVIVDKSSDGEFLRIDFNFSFPALSCEFAAVDMNDILGTYPIDPDLKPTGFEFHTGLISRMIKHDDEVDEEYAEGSFVLSEHNFDRFAHRHPILVVNFYAAWCHWSNRLSKGQWKERCLTTLGFASHENSRMGELRIWVQVPGSVQNLMSNTFSRYNPDVDGRILLGKVDCSEEVNLCRRHHIQGYPSIRIFRKGSDVRMVQREVCRPLQEGCEVEQTLLFTAELWGSSPVKYRNDSWFMTMEDLVAPVTTESQRLALKNELGNVADDAKRPAPLAGGCRIEGFVPGNLVISARSVAHSFDASKMNMSHIISNLSFGKKISPEVMSGLKRVVPYLGGSHDKLNGQE